MSTVSGSLTRRGSYPPRPPSYVLSVVYGREIDSIVSLKLTLTPGLVLTVTRTKNKTATMRDGWDRIKAALFGVFAGTPVLAAA